MKQKMILFTTVFFAVSALTVLLSQRKGGDQEQVQQYSQPEGGFTKKISGKWDCGDFGTLTLSQNGNNVAGTYTVNGGSVKGKISGNNFIGTWSESETGDAGSFDFELSIRRMVPNPTHLTGRWKNSNDQSWQTGWDCVK
ncbi:hypothetical protein [Leptospira sp. 'Mane']|uniref:hypothetical protein n=1 Tax=Leptospira sp. 'Mane' TaxID=3387407 RepID=UPI00398BB2E8